MLRNDEIERLEDMGFRRWTKGDMDRLYIDADRLGRDCPYIITTDQTRAREAAKLAAMPPAKKVPAYLRHRK